MIDRQSVILALTCPSCKNGWLLRAAVGVLVLAGVVGQPANAQTVVAPKLCGRSDTTVQVPVSEVIEACSATISSEISDQWARSDAYLVRSRAYFMLGDRVLSAADVTSAVKLIYSPESGTIGFPYMGPSDAAIDISHLSELILMGLGISETYVRRAGAFRQLKQYENAIADYDTALRRRPDNPLRVRALKARAIAAQGDQLSAVREFEAVLKAGPAVPEALSGLCLTLIATKGRDASEPICKRAFMADGPEGFGHVEIGAAYYAAGAYVPALDAFCKAVEKSPGNPVALFGRGWAKKKMGNPGGDIDIAEAERGVPSVNAMGKK